jgi:hypothetical protein
VPPAVWNEGSAPPLALAAVLDETTGETGSEEIAA